MASYNTKNYNKDFCLCSKYIIPILESELESREFWRFFLTKCAEAEVSEALLPQVVSAAYNGNLGLNIDTDYLMKYDGEVQDLPDLIDLIQYERSKKPDEFTDCRQYCASKLYSSDSASKAGLCKICERFNKWDYCNRLIDEDYSVIKYISTREENLEKFKKQVSMLSNKNDIRNPFRSMLELTRDYLCYKETPPVVIPIFNAMYTVICVASSRQDFFTKGPDTEARLRDDVFFMTLTRSLSKRDPYFKQFSENNADHWRVQYDIFIDEVMGSADIFNDDQFTDIIEDHLKNYWTSRRTRVKTAPKITIPENVSQITVFDLVGNINTVPEENNDSEYKLTAIRPEGEMLDLDANEPEDEKLTDTTLSEETTAVVEGDKGKSDDITEQMPVSASGHSGDATVVEPEVEEIVDQPDISSPALNDVSGDTKENNAAGDNLNFDTVSAETSQNNDVADDGSLNFDTAPSKGERKAVNRRPDDAGQTGRVADDIYVPHYPIYDKEDIQNIFKSVYMESNIYYSERLSKEKSGSYVVDNISIESLYVKDNGWTLVFTSPKDEDVWYCPIGDIPEGLKKLLVSDKVIKICYEPYILYSALRNVGVRARSCYSLYNMNRYLKIKKEVTDIASMEKIYLGLSQQELPTDITGMTMLVYNQIKNYNQLYTFQQVLAPEDSSTRIRTQLMRDEILGFSYMRETFLYDESVLFIRSEKGLLFNNNYVHSPTVSGYFVTYYLKTDSMDNSQRQRMYLYVLIEIMKKGVVNKYDFYIVALSNGIMTLFIAEESYSFMTNILHERMDAFAIDNELKGYVFEMVEEYIDVTLNLSDDERYARAVRHNDRLNELKRIRTAKDFIDKNSLDLNKTIEVSDSHFHIKPAPESEIQDKKNV